MRVTTDHAASSYGIPIIIDDNGALLDYATGIKALREILGITAADLARKCGVSTRAVNSWEQGWRPVPAAALNVMSDLLARAWESPATHDERRGAAQQP